MYDYTAYQMAPKGLLVGRVIQAEGELATALRELSTARVAYENAYVRVLLGEAGMSVADRERAARGNALSLRCSILEVEASVAILERELALLHYLLDTHAERQPPVDHSQ